MKGCFENFQVVEGNPMRVSLYLEKISKRLKGTNPYRCTYLENS